MKGYKEGKSAALKGKWHDCIPVTQAEEMNVVYLYRSKYLYRCDWEAVRIPRESAGCMCELSQASDQACDLHHMAYLCIRGKPRLRLVDLSP